jgi:hypothetical protein
LRLLYEFWAEYPPRMKWATEIANLLKERSEIIFPYLSHKGKIYPQVHRPLTFWQKTYALAAKRTWRRYI